MHKIDGVSRGDQYRALGLSTLAFTVCFAVWTIFSTGCRSALGWTGT